MLPRPPNESGPLRLTSCEARARLRRTETALAARAAGQTVWLTPDIAVRERWLFDQWAASWPDEQLLSPAQELAQWRRLIADDPATSDLVSTAALARQLRTADRLVHAYGMDMAASPAWTPEQAAFARWYAELDDQRRRAGELTAAQIPHAFARRLAGGHVHAPTAITLDHGDAHAMPPGQEQAIQALRAAGCEVEQPARPQPCNRLITRCHEDPDGEAQAVALDLAAWLQDADVDAPPTLVVAVDDLDARRAALESAFLRTLAPWRATPAHADAPLPWRFEPAPALTQAPLAAVALDIIGLRARDNRFAEVSRILLSAALWPADRQLDAAMLEMQVRTRAAPRIHLRELAARAPASLQPQWQRLQSCIDHEPRQAAPSAWAGHFADRLDALGWRERGEVDSAKWQSVRHVREALGQLAVLDRQLGAIGAGTAAGWLAELISQRAFAPRVDAVQPIIICDYRTAAELPCAARWVIGATDVVLPPRTQQQPFIARETLAKAGVVGAEPASALADARALANALCSDAEQVTLSYAALDANGADQRPSPLLAPGDGWVSTQRPATSHQRARLHRTAEPPLPSVTDPAAEGVRGGTAILRSCADSLFGAMVRHRLGVDALDEPPNGLDALTQGSVIHAVLADVWSGLGDAAALANCDDEALRIRITDAVDARLAQAMPGWRYPALVIAAERARLVRIIAAWMSHERRRTHAFTVIAHEREAELVFEGLPLRIRIDRLDRVETDVGPRHLIIDYKTGQQVRPAGWEADRLTEPQLPLYAAPEVTAALGIAAADGIAFAHVHDHRRALAAATNWAARLIDGERVVRKPEQFDALLDATHARLRELTRAFLAGEAGWQTGELADDALAVLVLPRDDPDADSVAPVDAAS